MPDDRARQRMQGLSSLTTLRDIRRQQAIGGLRAAISREEGLKERCLAEEAAAAAVCEWKSRNNASGTLEVALYAEALVVEAAVHDRSERARELLAEAGLALSESRRCCREVASSRDAVRSRRDVLRQEIQLKREIRDSEDATCLWLSGVERT